MRKVNWSQKPKRKRPEEKMYVEFCREFAFRFPKYIKFLYRHEHGGYVISKAEAGRRKKTCLKGGIADYGFHLCRGKYGALWIEFKVPGGKQQPNQKEFEEIITEGGDKYVLCYSAEEGIKAIKDYLSDKEQQIKLLKEEIDFENLKR